MPGACDRAEGGVLFLDEIGSLPLAMQGILLRVLESGDYQPVGGGLPRQLNARIVSATNIPLAELVAAGEFRDDLVFRLQRLTIEIPPLHQRNDDILPLCKHFLSNLRPDKEPLLGDDLISYYKSHRWPGNVRELRNDLELMTVLHGGTTCFKRQHSPLYQSQRKGNTARFVRKKEPAVAVPPITGGAKVHVRRDKIISLAKQHGSIARSDVVAAIACAPGTAAKDLAALESAGLLKRIVPNGVIRLTRFYPT